VDDYNAVIEAISSKTTESRAKDDNGDYTYVPLTDDQKKEMTQTAIDNWEKKAKQGILNNESNLSSALYDLGDVMSGIVESSGVKALSAIGIAPDPMNWNSNGKLIITESTLKAKIAEDPDAIAELFTNSTDGIATKLKKVLDKNVGTFGGNGILITYAGKDNSTTSENNNISTQLTDIKQKIKDLKKRLADEQDRYYSKFTYMEQQLSRISSQSNMFMQYGS
jgi:flagellar capping protein FliD